MKKDNLDFFIENSEGKIQGKQISCDYLKSNIIFNYNNDQYKYDCKNKVLIKENEESILILEFKKNKYTVSNYYIKKLDIYIDIKILTNKLITDNNKIHIEYELWVSDEYSGKFIFELKGEFK